MYKFLGKFLGIGIDVRECREVEFLEMREGKGSKREKHNPNLGRCQRCSNRLGFVGK